MQASVFAAVGSVSCGSKAPERRLSSCGTQALLFHSMWNLPRPEIELMSPMLAGRFFATEPTGKPWCLLINRNVNF